MTTRKTIGKAEVATTQALENALVQSICHRIRWVAVVFPGVGALLGIASGEAFAHTLTPACVSLTALLGGLFTTNRVHHVALILLVLVVAVRQHAVWNEGCSASVLPHSVYGSIPCLSALLFRTPKAVIQTTMAVMVALATVYVQDLNQNCPSTPMDPHNTQAIVEHRLIPAVASILINCILLVVVVQQSQESVQVHATATQEAQHLALLRHDLLHRVTHELRTPLHGAAGSVELLLASQNLCAEDRETTEMIQQCLQSITGTCDNVLLAANVSSCNSAGAQVSSNMTKKSIFSLARCIDDVVEAFGASAEAKGIELRVEFLGDTECLLRGMENQLLQVLRNLVNNAIKFTDHGHVTIHVETTPRGSHALGCKFQIKDTGHGIEPREQYLLFHPFHQVERNAVLRRYAGAGLGLTIVRELVQLMGGSIQVQSDGPGKGSTFSFELILRTASSILTNNKQIRGGGDYCDGEIVIVDSQKESRNSCLSVVETIAASQILVRTMESLDSLVEYAVTMERPPPLGSLAETTVTEQPTENPMPGGRYIAILECQQVNDQFSASVNALHNFGWLVFVHGNPDVYETALNTLQNCTAIFSRPLRLTNLGDALHGALVGPQMYLPEDEGPIIDSSSVFWTAEGDVTLAPEPSTRVPAEISIGPSAGEPAAAAAASASTVVDADASTTKQATSRAEKRHSLNAKPPSRESFTQTRQSFTQTSMAGLPPTVAAVAALATSLTKSGANDVSRLELPTGSQVVVVDDTPLNVKVLTKILSRIVSVPVVSLYSGQAAIDFVQEQPSHCGPIFFLMDWHMPSVCGLTASKAIRILSEQNGLDVYISIVTADIEGLYLEMEKSEITYHGTVSRGVLTLRDDDTASLGSASVGSHGKSGGSSSTTDGTIPDDLLFVDLVAGKPVTIQSVRTILEYFDGQTRISK